MFRDKYKDQNYFTDRFNFNKKTFERREGPEHRKRVLPERLNRYYLSQSNYSKNLVNLSYSLRKTSNDVFMWFKTSLHYYSLFYTENDGIFAIIDYLSLAVLFEERKSDFIEDISVLFEKYTSYVDRGEEYVQDDFIETLALYLLEEKEYPFHSHLEYLNMIGDTADSVIEAQKFWYYAHSEASWYGSHESKDAYYGYWSFDTAALCKIRGIYDDRFKELDFFPYDLLVQG